jgi:predicted Zn-dependent peptidase
MNYKKTILKNGLRLLFVPIPSVESATTTIWIRTGSRNEDKRINGISHFLEHMVFKGSKKRPSAKEISEAVDSLGAEFNAGTSKELTNFYIKSRAGVIEEAMDILSDMLLNPLLEENDIEREKGVILEEMSMYEDTPMFKIGDLFENLIFQKSTLGMDISGTPRSVKNTQKSDFVNYRKKYYYPENILITISGGVDEKRALKLTEEFFGNLDKTGKNPEKPKVKFKQTKAKVSLKTKKVDQTHIILGFRGDPMGAKRRFAESILSSILGGGMSSRLFTEVREKRGLAYAIKTSSDHYIDNGYLATYAGLDVEATGEAIKVMLDQYYGLASEKYPISPKEFKKAKEYIKGNIALSLEDTKNINSFFGVEELILGKPQTPETVFKSIDKVEVDEVIEVAKDFFKLEKLNIALIGPFKDTGRFENLLK